MDGPHSGLRVQMPGANTRSAGNVPATQAVLKPSLAARTGAIQCRASDKGTLCCGRALSGPQKASWRDPGECGESEKVILIAPHRRRIIQNDI
jgi:hypothetical protein